ncbi:queuosine salvage protein [Chloropicon primus]|uniref:Queuosine 5'-phosphate N-glycosylase/hydrolase n=2 Tax=Chloropicon primus TaxID=1764295 RepID=A0A5B8MVJ8_9CHLO|nr:hypothetical protein A3770_13p69450 [Chloropicon primus]UPR03635.1 queuosine salvage protein [Chloropicon primus]|eukprot:QDZ24427.1 hypothetical protein A3770_13p69450 [Chloropicon primus]
MALSCPLQCVRRTTEHVASVANHVTISKKGIEALVSSRLSEESVRGLDLRKWDETDHLVETDQQGHHHPDVRAQYMLVVDAVNFCFWPDDELEYEHIAGNLKASVSENPSCISSESLATLTPLGLRALLKWPRPLPQEEERARLVREVGIELGRSFGGQAANLVRAANQSAAELVRLVVAHFPGFRDSCVYGGSQVFLYKRAQIFVGDLYGSFRGEGLGKFRDIANLTMFADYRVPVTLLELGVLEYGKELSGAVAAKEVLEPGCPQEVEIRACTVRAVEMILEEMRRTFKDASLVPMSIELDWFLWKEGEKRRDVSDPHHRVLTIFY